jgi:hypothetical protein
MTSTLEEWQFETGGNNPLAWEASAQTLRGAADAIRDEVRGDN